MLVPTLLRNAPLCESLREYAARRKVWSLEVEGVSSARLTPETVRHPGTALCRASRLAISVRALPGRNLRRANVD